MKKHERVNSMNTVHFVKKSPASPLRHACAECASHDWCLPAGLDAKEAKLLDRLAVHNRLIGRGGTIYRSGTAFHSLYAIRSGFVKSTITLADGRERVTGLHMQGEMVGMDAINTGQYMCDAVALENSSVCAIPFDELESLTRELPALQRYLHRMMSREIAHDYGVMLLLGSMHAEERVAVFLADLSKRYAARGYSPTRINLLLKRDEIGSYLGLKLETVSRVLSRFQRNKLIAVQHKDVEILDLDRLNRMVRSHHDIRQRVSQQALRAPAAAPAQPALQYA
jgi:CRP/FNR family transcriptional regulator, anaerobic regulatory protein